MSGNEIGGLRRIGVGAEEKGRIYGEEERPREVSRRLSGKESAKGATTACRSPTPTSGFPHHVVHFDRSAYKIAVVYPPSSLLAQFGTLMVTSFLRAPRGTMPTHVRTFFPFRTTSHVPHSPFLQLYLIGILAA